MASSTQARRSETGAAPARRTATCPRRSTISVGMACTLKRCWSLGESSTLTFPQPRQGPGSAAGSSGI